MRQQSTIQRARIGGFAGTLIGQSDGKHLLMNKKNKILRKHRSLTGAPLADKSLHVVGKMTGNPNFLKPDVDPTLMTTTANQLLAATVTAMTARPKTRRTSRRSR